MLSMIIEEEAGHDVGTDLWVSFLIEAYLIVFLSIDLIGIDFDLYQ